VASRFPAELLEHLARLAEPGDLAAADATAERVFRLDRIYMAEVRPDDISGGT
jgi:hypothetical protein